MSVSDKKLKLLADLDEVRFTEHFTSKANKTSTTDFNTIKFRVISLLMWVIAAHTLNGCSAVEVIYAILSEHASSMNDYCCEYLPDILGLSACTVRNYCENFMKVFEWFVYFRKDCQKNFKISEGSY